MFKTPPNFESLAEALVSLFGNSIAIAQTDRLSGGDINKAYALHLNNGERVFMKANETDQNTLSAVCIWGLVDAPEGKKDYVYKMNSPYGCFLNTKYEIKTCFDRVYHVLKGE